MALIDPEAALTGIDAWVLVLYFLCIPAFGAWVGRGTSSLTEFFLAGRKFPGWLVGFSCVATVVGSYSFVKYSSAGFKYGLASSQTYFNDWIWMPLFLFGWLPILYAAGLYSVPNYFEKRFNPKVAKASGFVLLLYLVGYIGINLFTIGRALEALLGIDLFLMAAVVTLLCLAYEFTGGQTSVIWTDLVQAVLLLAAGLFIAFKGLSVVGGWSEWLAHTPQDFTAPLADFSANPRFNFVGIFWQDALAGGIVFYFMNQGMLLRFLSARSVAHARRAALWVLLLLMPLAAIAVSGAGWIGSAMQAKGLLPQGVQADEIFVRVSEQLAGPGLFGIVMAALLAALMSTADTLINASSSILVRDLWKPKGSEKRQLSAARWSSLAIALAGLALVPLYQQFGSIYEAHGAFTASITPPMAVTLMLAILWPKFPARAALVTLLGGTLIMFVSLKWPVLVSPFDHGIPAEGGYKYIRAAFGISSSLILAIVGAFVFRKDKHPDVTGLTLWTYRPKFHSAKSIRVSEYEMSSPRNDPEVEPGSAYLPPSLAKKLNAEVGDTLFVEPKSLWQTGKHGQRFRVKSVEHNSCLQLHVEPTLALHRTPTVLCVEVVDAIP